MNLVVKTGKLIYMEMNPEVESSPKREVKVYTYQDLMDPRTFSLITNRIEELTSKSELTEIERSQLRGMHSAWFRHMFDHI